MAKSTAPELLDSLTLADDASVRIVEKTFRVRGRRSYAESDALASDAGWQGEPAGRRSSRVRSSYPTADGWVISIEFSIEKTRTS